MEQKKEKSAIEKQIEHAQSMADYYKKEITELEQKIVDVGYNVLKEELLVEELKKQIKL